MKSRTLLSSLFLAIMVSAGSLEIGKGIINTFSFDIFRKCVDGEYSLDSSVCQYGPQVSINLLSTLIFFVTSIVLFRVVTGLVLSRYGILVMSLLYFVLLGIFWRIQVSLQDNFVIVSGPVSFGEYLYVGFVWLDTILAGIIVGLASWLPKAVNRNARDRKEPRESFRKTEE